MDNFCEDLTSRMENVDKLCLQRKKNISKDYDNGKPSPLYYRHRAIEKLERIIKDCESYENFKLYIESNPKEFSEEEENQIRPDLDRYLEDKSAFEKKKKELSK